MVAERDLSLSYPAGLVTWRNELPSIVTISQAYGSPRSVPITGKISRFHRVTSGWNGVAGPSVPVAEILNDFVFELNSVPIAGIVNDLDGFCLLGLFGSLASLVDAIPSP